MTREARMAAERAAANAWQAGWSAREQLLVYRIAKALYA